MDEEELRRLVFTQALDQWRAGELEVAGLTYRVMMRDFRAKNLGLTEYQAGQIVVRWDNFVEDRLENGWDLLARRGIVVDDDIATQAFSKAREPLEFFTEDQLRQFLGHLSDELKHKLLTEFEAGEDKLWLELWESTVRLSASLHAYFVGFLTGTDGLAELE